MNKSILFALVFFSTLSAFAQKPDEKKSIFRAAAILGFNATQVDGDDLAGYRKLGLNAGGAAFILLPKNFSVNFEILYSQKGARASSNQLTNDVLKKIVLDYVDVPVLINYHDKDKEGNDVAIFGVGVIFNSLVRYKLEDIYGTLSPGTEIYERFGAEAAANVTFVFARKFGINLRFAYSLNNIAAVPIAISNLKNGGQRNNMLAARAMYFF